MATANNAFCCSLCGVFLLPKERRKVFSSSSEFVLPLLKQVVVDVFSKVGKLLNVFLLGSTLCRLCHRQLVAIIKMQKDLKGKLHELKQQVKRLGGHNGVRMNWKLCISVVRHWLQYILIHCPGYCHLYRLIDKRHVRAGTIVVLLPLPRLKTTNVHF